MSEVLTQGQIRLSRNSRSGVLKATFVPPLPDEELWHATLSNCPILGLRYASRHKIGSITYQHTIAGARYEDAPKHFIAGYEEVAQKLDRELVVSPLSGLAKYREVQVESSEAEPIAV